MSHILVVDDSSVDRNLVRRLLEKRPEFHVEFASNGLEAIEHIELSTPLLVVSDLNMPEMDGLALVKQMRHRFPTIPVILMTAFGSEDIAVEALTEGAADFVPKHLLGTELLKAVDSNLAVAAGDRRHVNLTRYLRFEKLQYEIPSEPQWIAPVADEIQQSAVNFGVVLPADRMRLSKCLVEALRNAVVHGRPQPTDTPAGTTSATLGVTVDVEFTPAEARFIIRDQGPGFDPLTVVHPRLDPQHLTAEKGRGLTLIQLFMDEVHFNETGNEISMLKRRQPSNGDATLTDGRI